jgi:hypothetical protein
MTQGLKILSPYDMTDYNLNDEKCRRSAFYCFRRACCRACAAIGALARINDVNGIAFADCFARAFGDAGPAGNAGIGDNMWHRVLLEIKWLKQSICHKIISSG